MTRRTRGEGRLDIVMAAGCLLLSAIALLAPRTTRNDLAQAVRRTVLAPVVRIESRAATIRAVVLSRDSVLQARGRHVSDTLAVRAIADENAILRRLMGLGARLQDGFVPAELLPTGNGDEFTLGLTAGRNVGVVPFLPVVTADGLLGMIESADATTSFAITWGHPDFAVSAMSADQRAFGIVKPHLGRGAERWLLEMRGVPFRARLDTGALIVSSGLGATYPRGIPIGTVMGELVTPEKWARTYLIKPAVLPDATGPVLVLLPSRAQRGVNGVWTTVLAADSAARALAAAGDSLAKAAALDELAARRAALDTVPVDSLGRPITPGVANPPVVPPGTTPSRPGAKPDSGRTPPAARVGPPPARVGPPPVGGRP
ncbi:MAG: rod shape-determining protein MreC [Gemmatimonadetes bacterium]|nr:rod shape-determining protein MreC [Gemmatimonadota bacterium]